MAKLNVWSTHRAKAGVIPLVYCRGIPNLQPPALVKSWVPHYNVYSLTSVNTQKYAIINTFFLWEIHLTVAWKQNIKMDMTYLLQTFSKFLVFVVYLLNCGDSLTTFLPSILYIIGCSLTCYTIHSYYSQYTSRSQVNSMDRIFSLYQNSYVKYLVKG